MGGGLRLALFHGMKSPSLPILLFAVLIPLHALEIGCARRTPSFQESAARAYQHLAAKERLASRTFEIPRQTLREARRAL